MMKTFRLAMVMLVIGAALSGCSTSKEEMLPPGDSTMLQLWQGEDGGGSSRNAVVARDILRRPLAESESQASVADDRSYSRTQESEISQQFPRLPNPDLVMYVFPHLADGNTPVPGYSTVFPFYSQVQYAMPGERTEAY
ncbi:TIGR03751 family conjugal transfer lipoprotein [Pluralibacter gergoviae]|uniref:TIGR03751 family conjugal transfer lipoprotein n=2 Tax=Gammaproteobacteria TaxID=1236 RepID=UPI0007D9F4B4|nr:MULTISPECIES: TIGR03751 family conjugal transfer lipoprotein [Enterobacterales]EKV9909456.1 TIGR03751 family conjugal transfer lipoprotein [Pluralibacter gergoviae]HBX4000058.1 TIGR03751 family conjugal transfer lipoprotein [Klebsiella variicola]ELD4333510.1 TIGR03751 family conjugal transfer lipoprotein [Pluralibacter gergoviae]MBZ6860914.1 TIGR03751 family conjugal transfer lipoprotein [Klebsiella michiganensis]MBZ7422485.1 TIGR03751 family conjugal transfer lipoprotein [Klebsiella michig